MEYLQAIMAFLASADFAQYLALAMGLLTSLLAICLVIPGEQPDKFLQAVVDFIKKFSRK